MALLAMVSAYLYLHSLRGIPFFIDIDECSIEEGFPCHPNAMCSNTISSFLCTCVTGYSGGGKLCEGDDYLK